jgi:prevent-host-death family protein
METMAVSKLRANLMKVLKEIEQGDSVNITSRGRVVAKLVPPDHTAEKAREKLNEIAKAAVLHDLIAPIDVSWKVMEE